MNNQFRKIAVLTSGGDAPGMNACVRAVTRTALAHGLEVIGVMGGYSGLINDNLKPLGHNDVSNIVGKGGTFLYSDRCLEFKTPEGMAKAVACCKENGIDGIVCIGGDGTFRGATDLSNHGIPTIGLTGSIDNDITASDYTIGFDTAMNTVCDAVDRLRDTCESHARCNVVEVMGRDCGEIALRTGIACGAVGVVIPETPFDADACIEKIKALKAGGKRNFIVMVSEGVFADVDGKQVKYGEVFAKRIEAETGIETKFARLAHIVRGGNPTLRDRQTASEMGAKAVELMLEGKSNLVVVERNGELVECDINYSHTVDAMYKGKLKEGALDAYSAEEVASMKELCAYRKAEIERLYAIANEIA